MRSSKTLHLFGASFLFCIALVWHIGQLRGSFQYRLLIDVKLSSYFCVDIRISSHFWWLLLRSFVKAFNRKTSCFDSINTRTPPEHITDVIQCLLQFVLIAKH